MYYCGYDSLYSVIISELEIFGPSIMSPQRSPLLDSALENMKRSNSLKASLALKLSPLGFAISTCCQSRPNGVFLPFPIERPPSLLSHKTSDNISRVIAAPFTFKIFILLQNSFSLVFKDLVYLIFPKHTPAPCISL